MQSLFEEGLVGGSKALFVTAGKRRACDQRQTVAPEHAKHYCFEQARLAVAIRRTDKDYVPTFARCREVKIGRGIGLPIAESDLGNMHAAYSST